jgi:hypothetical protein
MKELPFLRLVILEQKVCQSKCMKRSLLHHFHLLK